jgi:hypothetical protein
MNVKCNKCGHVGDESTFPKGLDFFQNTYISGCPAAGCENRQNPGDASMRMFGGARPFEYQRDAPKSASVVETVMQRASNAS